MALRLTLRGFENYLAQLKDAGADVERIAEKALKESGDILYKSLVENTKGSGLNEDTIRKMEESLQKPTIYKDYLGDRISKVTCELGYRKGKYDPDDLSGGYVALFNEYGTVERHTEQGADRGKLAERQFTRRAIKQTSNRIRKTQQSIIEDGLREVVNP